MRKFLTVALITAAMLCPALAEVPPHLKLRKGEKDVIEGTAYFAAIYADFTRCLVRSKDTVIENSRRVLKQETADESVRTMAAMFATIETCKAEMNAAGRICSTRMSEPACALLGGKIADRLYAK